MLIDWFTVVAQAVNFLILAWLLKTFLYGPIIRAMRERRERLAGELASARKAREDADRRAEDLSSKREKLELAAETMLSEARKEADDLREQWLAEARVEVEARSKAWQEAVERERAGLSDRLKTRMAEQVVRMAERALRDLAGEDLEARALGDFVSRLARAQPEADISGRVVVRTGFHLSPGILNRLRESIAEHYPKCTEIEASEDEALGFGIVMVAGDAKWEWNLASYLDDVEEAIFAELAETKAGT